MIAHRKVVAPVTPRIIQTTPQQRRARYGLLVFAFLLTAWGGYEYGKAAAPVANPGVPPASSDESLQRIKALEQERGLLKQQVAELKQSLTHANQAITRIRARSRLSEPTSRPQAAPSREKAPAPNVGPAVAVSAQSDLAIALRDLRIEPAGVENTFRITLSVVNEAGNDDRITGTVWIAVNGFSGKTPTRLAFRTLSPDKRLYVKMGFNRRQDITEEIILPADFRPKNILIEAKPYGKKYSGDSQKIAWQFNPPQTD